MGFCGKSVDALQDVPGQSGGRLGLLHLPAPRTDHPDEGPCLLVLFPSTGWSWVLLRVLWGGAHSWVSPRTDTAHALLVRDTAVILPFTKAILPRLPDHFLPLTEVTVPLSFYAASRSPTILTYAFLVILTITGIIHFLRTSYNDQFRIRLFYYSFMHHVLSILSSWYFCPSSAAAF